MKATHTWLGILGSAAVLLSCDRVADEADGRSSSARAMAVCDCPPGFFCDFEAENPGVFFCSPSPPPVIYVRAGEFCGIGTDEMGRTVEFRCRLDAHCAAQVCVCTHFPGGPCGPISCPEGTFCESDVYGDFWCGMYAGECSGT